MIPEPGREPETTLQLTKFYNTGSCLRSEEDTAAAPASQTRSPVTPGKQQAPFKHQETSRPTDMSLVVRVVKGCFRVTESGEVPGGTLAPKNCPGVALWAVSSIPTTHSVALGKL